MPQLCSRTAPEGTLHTLLFSWTFIVCVTLLSTSCTDDGQSRTENGCVDDGGEGATASCIRPTRDPDYYVEQAEAYFDTLDIDARRDSVPNYHPLVVRWEWPPWLLLNGLGDQAMIAISDGLRDFDPSTVPLRDCRFFDVQPFARCYVVFEYHGGPCPIYEEFTFDEAGQMSFIEAWSDQPGLLPNGPDDPWGESPDYPRLSTRVPGLGRPDGRFDVPAESWADQPHPDPEVAHFLRLAANWRVELASTLANADPNFFSIGGGWPIP